MINRSHPVTVAALVFLFWAAAGVLVVSVHEEIDARSASAGAAATIAAIAIAAWAYTRWCARNAGLSHALGVGIAWLTLAMAAEMAMTTRLGRDWYDLLGSADRPLLRNIYFFVWIFAPAVFARREVEA